MSNMRAKMKLQSVTKTEFGEKLQFSAVAKNGFYPEDGSDDDNTYAKFTPSADLTIQVSNPALFGKFLPGEKYYVDFSKAE